MTLKVRTTVQLELRANAGNFMWIYFDSVEPCERIQLFSVKRELNDSSVHCFRCTTVKISVEIGVCSV